MSDVVVSRFQLGESRRLIVRRAGGPEAGFDFLPCHRAATFFGVTARS
jgi:hypothetical protein